MRLDDLLLEAKSVLSVNERSFGDVYDYDIYWLNMSYTSLEGGPKEVHGDFNVANNKLRSLEFAPKDVTGAFNCSQNYLTSLAFSPVKVRNFLCAHNRLETLEGITQKFRSNCMIDCSHNHLTSLKGLPVCLIEHFDCTKNHLTTLTSLSPDAKFDTFICDQNDLTSLAGLVSATNIKCRENELTSLKGIHHHVRYARTIDFSGNQIKSHVLGLMKIEGLKHVTFEGNKSAWTRKMGKGMPEIINMYLMNNDNGCNLEACADALCEEGYEDFVQL